MGGKYKGGLFDLTVPGLFPAIAVLQSKPVKTHTREREMQFLSGLFWEGMIIPRRDFLGLGTGTVLFSQILGRLLVNLWVVPYRRAVTPNARTRARRRTDRFTAFLPPHHD